MARTGDLHHLLTRNLCTFVVGGGVGGCGCEVAVGGGGTRHTAQHNNIVQVKIQTAMDGWMVAAKPSPSPTNQPNPPNPHPPTQHTDSLFHSHCSHTPLSHTISLTHQVTVHPPVVQCLINLHSQQPQGCTVNPTLCCCQGLKGVVGLATVGGTCVGGCVYCIACV